MILASVRSLTYKPLFKPINEVLEEYMNKQIDIELNGDDNVKKEYLEPIDEAMIKQEDKEEEDDVQVESLVDDQESQDFEIDGIESDYNGSVMSEDENEATEEGSKTIPEDELNSLNETKSDSEKENNELQSLREKYENVLSRVVYEKAAKHVKNIPKSIEYFNKQLEKAQSTVHEQTICIIIDNITTQLENGDVSWKESLKSIASELKTATDSCLTPVAGVTKPENQNASEQTETSKDEQISNKPKKRGSLEPDKSSYNSTDSSPPPAKVIKLEEKNKKQSKKEELDEMSKNDPIIIDSD